MRRFSTLASVMIGAAIWMAGPQAQAAGGHAAAASLASGKTIFTQGKGDVPACNSCHGENGMGNDAMGTPRLAGQISQFIKKQLEDFANDRRQDTTMFVMNTNAKGLSPQDRRDVAAYVSSLAEPGLPPVSELSNIAELKANGTEVGVSYQGKSIVNYGIPERSVPACRSCHDYNGRGVDPIYPMIGGQKYVYLTNQLKKWRDGSRANDPLAQMQKVAQKLTDEEIRDVATFLSSASPYTAGNNRTPERHGFMAFDTGTSAD